MTDGLPRSPATWRLFDPDHLPYITTEYHHDSSGVNGFPANVSVGDRALAYVAAAGTSVRNRDCTGEECGREEQDRPRTWWFGCCGLDCCCLWHYYCGFSN